MLTLCFIYHFHNFLISWMSIIFKHRVNCFHSRKSYTYLQNSGINLVLPLVWLPQLALCIHHHTDSCKGYSSWVGQLFTAPGWACSFITTSFDYTLFLQAFIFPEQGGVSCYFCVQWESCLCFRVGSTFCHLVNRALIAQDRCRLKKSLHPQPCEVVISCFPWHLWALSGWLPVQMLVRRQSVCLSPVGLLFTYRCSTRIYKSLE